MTRTKDPATALYALLKRIAQHEPSRKLFAGTREFSDACLALPKDLDGMERTRLQDAFNAAQMPTPSEADAYFTARLQHIEQARTSLLKEREAFEAHKKSVAQKVRDANAEVLKTLRHYRLGNTTKANHENQNIRSDRRCP